jgi:hypothetical protein
MSDSAQPGGLVDSGLERGQHATDRGDQSGRREGLSHVGLGAARRCEGVADGVFVVRALT